MITQRLIEILDELRGVIKQQELKISNDVLFEQACGFLRGEFAGKKFNQKVIESSNTSIGSSPNPVITPFDNISKHATPKQYAYAHYLADSLKINLKLGKDLTTREISAIIKELEEKRHIQEASERRIK